MRRYSLSLFLSAVLALPLARRIDLGAATAAGLAVLDD